MTYHDPLILSERNQNKNFGRKTKSLEGNQKFWRKTKKIRKEILTPLGHGTDIYSGHPHENILKFEKHI